jgi:hypothetical protein
MKIKSTIIISVLIFMGAAQASEMRFDKHGNMLLPDHTYLTQGLKDLEEGYPNDAMRHLKKSAKFGNPYAQSAIAYVHLQKQDHVTALAWFQLVDLKMVDKDEAIIDIMAALEQAMTPSQLEQVAQSHAELKLAYGKTAAMEHRMDWQNNISIGGTKLKGRVPGDVTVYPSGRIEKRGMEFEIFVSPVAINAQQVQLQMEEFVFEYELRFTEGRVRMGEVELLETDQQI